MEMSATKLSALKETLLKKECEASEARQRLNEKSEELGELEAVFVRTRAEPAEEFVRSLEAEFDRNRREEVSHCQRCIIVCTVPF